MNIDEIAQKIVSSFNVENDEILKVETKNMLRLIKNEESMFSVVRHPYLVAKSLYFMLTEDYLTEEEQISVIKLVYFCLLDNYLNNKDKKPGDSEYEDLVSGCKLALVLISMQHKFLMFSIIAGQARYINPSTHIRNQILLFGGIVKEAEISHCYFPLEEVIDRYFVDIYREFYSRLPIEGNLAILKEKCTPVIKNIKSRIRDNFKEFEDDLW